MFTSLLNKKISILAKVQSQDNAGQVSESWFVYKINVASRCSEASKNFSVSDTNYKVTKETYVFFVDSDIEVDKNNRILYEDKEYYIVKVTKAQDSQKVHHQQVYCQIVSAGSQSGIQNKTTISDNAPLNPKKGDVWIDSTL